MHSPRVHVCRTQDALPPTVLWPAFAQPKPSAVLLPCRGAEHSSLCVSGLPQPHTVLTNVLLIRWLNYSCKNNVDISLKIAVCQILLANLGFEPLLSNSFSNPPLFTPHLPLSGFFITFPLPYDFSLPLSHFPSCHRLQTYVRSKKPTGSQTNSHGLWTDLDCAESFLEPCDHQTTENKSTPSD